MKQHELNNGELTLRVKRSPVFVRIVIFLFAFLFFLLPLVGMILSILMGDGFHIGFLIGIGFFGLMGFYLLRIGLWNTYGTEIIKFQSSKVIYEANYGWFKDAKKTKEIIPLSFSLKPIGYGEDNEGVLIIGSNDFLIECATKMSINEINELIKKLKVDNNV
ncbi:MAG: hypothetical protein HRT66_10040 [Flavobacteriaceae bacterium]|nr:hypothetical protein [Flavobacteriaceae bacterium]